MRKLTRSVAAGALAAGLLTSPVLVGDAGAASTVGARVRIVDNAFMNSEVTILVGERVVWKNNGSNTHTSTSDTGKWDSGFLGPGARFGRVFRRAGTFTYHCTVHPSMQGTVIVNTP